MRAHTSFLLLFLATAGPAAAAPELKPVAPPPEAQGVPWYVPRAAFGGTFYNVTWTPQLRLAWEVAIIQSKNDAMLAFFEGGGGYAVWMPRIFGLNGQDAMTFFYQHTAMLGLAYQARYSNGLCWGFQVGTGPVFYGARIENLPTENIVAGWVEGRAHVGWRFGKITYGISAGYANLYNPPRRTQQSGSFVAGPVGGFYMDWRP
jgi:hypothetical protein